MLVGQRMSQPVITIHPDMAVQDALNLMRKENIRRFPVVTDSGALVGIVSERDLLHASPSNATSLSVWELNYLISKIKVASVMSSKVVTVTEDYPGHLSLTVTNDSPALLVISEAYYPGWAASVNGQPVSVLEADAYLMAIPVPAGNSTVELNYRPVMLLVGALISLLSLAACITLIVFRPREAFNL